MVCRWRDDVGSGVDKDLPNNIKEVFPPEKDNLTLESEIESVYVELKASKKHLQQLSVNKERLQDYLLNVGAADNLGIFDLISFFFI